MKNFISLFAKTIIFIIAILCTTFLFLSLLHHEPGIGMLHDVEPLSISGTASIDGRPEEAIQTTLWEDGINRSLIVTGKFNRDIKSGDSLIIWPRNLRIKLFVNDKLMISTGQREEFPSYIQYAGNSFQIFYIGSISTTDTIRIEIQKAYESCRINVINSFFSNIYTGKESAVYQSIMKNELFQPTIGLSLVIVGILVLFLSIFQDSSLFKHARQIYYLGCFCIAGGISYICDSSYEFIDLLFPHLVFNTLLDLYSIPVLLYFYLMYIFHSVEHKRTKQFMKCIILLYVVLELIPLLLQVTGIYDLHVLQDLYITIGGILILFTFCSLLYEILYLKNRELIKVAITAFPLMFALTLKIFNVFLEQGIERSYLRIGILSSCFLLLHSTIKFIKRSITLSEQEKKMKEELQNTQIAIMLGQIQPHFLYNTLNTLQYICQKDSKLAAEAIEHFSKYLRGNVDSLTSNRPIPFTQELEHVKNYLYIEKLRFGNRVCVDYDLELTNFYIPTLTLQPIVENAIRHGITKQANGGIVKIQTRQVDDEIWIIVTDNGVGVAQNDSASQQRSHIGIDNVKKRLQLQCNGTIDITRSDCTGTQVTIRLKGQRLENENTSR